MKTENNRLIMRNVLIAEIMLNDDGYELVKELPSTTNQWSIREVKAIRQLLDSGLDSLEIGDTSFYICK
jgi:hypothetical protein